MAAYRLLEALNVHASLKEILAGRSKRSLIQSSVLDSIVDVDEC